MAELGASSGVAVCDLQHAFPTENIAAFEVGSFLPLPSREAVERSIGRGGNGTISIVYFKGAEFAVKRISNTRWCMSYRVACDLS